MTARRDTSFYGGTLCLLFGHALLRLRRVTCFVSCVPSVLWPMNITASYKNIVLSPFTQYHQSHYLSL
jgi:hypothetical protein